MEELIYMLEVIKENDENIFNVVKDEIIFNYKMVEGF